MLLEQDLQSAGFFLEFSLQLLLNLTRVLRVCLQLFKHAVGFLNLLAQLVILLDQEFCDLGELLQILLFLGDFAPR